jgi:hypothetical protein
MNKSTNKTLFLLVVRDLAIFRKTWHEAYRFLLFLSKQKNPKTTAVKTDIVGVFVSPSLLLPGDLRLDNSFGLSGVWSLCEIHSACQAKSNRRKQIDVLAQTLLKRRSLNLKGKDNDNQIFFPAFKESTSRDIIARNLCAIEEKYSCQIKRFFLFHYKTAAFTIKKSPV